MPTIDFTLAGSGEWGDNVGETLSVDEAAEILAQRLGKTYEYRRGTRGSRAKENQIATRELIESLVALIPEGWRTATVLREMDPRTLLAAVMSTETGAKGRGDYEINGQTFTPAMQIIAGSLYVDQKQQLRQTLEQQLIDAGFPVEQIADLAHQELEQWRESRNTLVRMSTPTGQVISDPTSGQIVTSSANADLSDFASFANDLLNGAATPTDQKPVFLTPEDIKLMFRDQTANSAISGYMQDLAARQQAVALGLVPQAPRDTLNVQMTNRTRDQGPYMRPGATPQEQNEARYGSDTYTLTEALSLPTTMSRAEIQRLSDKMEKAGIFAQVGGSPLVKGDPTDPQFKEAYRLLLAKSIQRGEPVSTVLQTDMLAYEESLEDSVRARLTDPARIRASADSLGREILGRKLTDKEKATLVKTVNELEKQQALEEADEDGGDVTEVDWESRMAEFIRNANPGEAESHDLANQYDTFRGLLAGPGGAR